MIEWFKGLMHPGVFIVIVSGFAASVYRLAQIEHMVTSNRQQLAMLPEIVQTVAEHKILLRLSAERWNEIRVKLDTIHKELSEIEKRSPR